MDHHPVEIQRNFAVLKNLSKVAQDVEKQVVSLTKIYFDKARKLTKPERENKLNELKSLQNEAKEFAFQTLGMVSKIMSSFINFDIFII